VYAWPFLGLFALNLLVFLFFTLPRSIKERGMARQALELREVIAARRQDIAGIRRQAYVVKANIDESARFFKETVASCEAGKTTILEDLFKMTSELSLRSDRTGMAEKEVKGLPLVEMTITMPVAGTYQQVGTFLQKIESSEHFLVVESVTMRERTLDGGGADLDIRIVSYCRPASGARKAANR
jgi:Tfp pilus assembly protein PilO